MNDPIFTAIRAIRAIDDEDRAVLERRLLEVVASATGSARARLALSPAGQEIHFGLIESVVQDTARLELHFPRRAGSATLTLGRASPFAKKDAVLAEIVGGEMVVRLDHDRAEREAKRLGRQIELLRGLSRASASAERVPEVADRAAVELLRAFEGAHISVHLVVEKNLELVARRVESRESMGGVVAVTRAPSGGSIFTLQVPLEALPRD